MLNLSLQSIERLFISISGIIVLSIMGLIALEVAFRYLFHTPLEFSYELIGIYLLPASVLLGLADVQRRDGHIAVDVVYHMLSERVQRSLSVFTLALSAALCALVAYVYFHQMVDRWSSAKVIVGWTLWPTWITAALVWFGFSLLTLRLILQSIGMARGTEALPKSEVDHTLEAQQQAERT